MNNDLDSALESAISINATEFTSKVWDVVIVGGGMVGATVALGLGQQGMSVLLLEKQAIDTSWQADSPYQVRVSALTRASEKYYVIWGHGKA